MSDNSFAKLYKTKSNADLLFITARAKDYQSIAVDTARQELESRQLTSEELDAAKVEVAERLQAIEPKGKKDDEEKSKFTSSAEPFLDIIDPEHVEPAPSIDINKKTITIFLCVYFAYLIYSYRALFSFIVNGDWFFGAIINLVPFFAVPVGTALFWLEKKAGWILCTAAVFHAASIGVFSLIRLARLFFDTTESFGPAILIPVIYTFIMCGGTWALCLPKIRRIYRINLVTMFVVLAFGFMYDFVDLLLYGMMR